MPTGFLPTGIVQGDFNEDGKQDLAISNGGDNTVYVLLSKGDGTFQTPVILYTIGQSPVSLAAIRSHTAGHMDIAVVDGDTNQLELFSGRGDGSFALPVALYTFQQIPSYVVSADINHDGNADLAIGLTIDGGATAPTFAVIFGDGAGGFGSPTAGPAIANKSGDPLPDAPLIAADLNNDGFPDFATGFGFVYRNEKGTGFAPTAELETSDGLVAFAFGDLNEDGCPDVAATGEFGLLTLATGNCDGTFSGSRVAAETADLDFSIGLADVNGDGHLDVIAASAFDDDLYAGIDTGAPGGYLADVLEGDGHGNVGTAALYRVGSDNYALATLDLNGDGRPEIVTLSQGESKGVLLVNDGNGGFGNPSGEAIGYTNAAVDAPVPGTTPLTLDLNGDGKPDVLLLEYGLDQQPDVLASLLNDGTGKLGQPVRSPITFGSSTPSPILLTAGAFRSSSMADVVYASVTAPGTVNFAAGTGAGRFGTPITLATLPAPALIASGDFDGDGKLDFAVYGDTAEFGSTGELDIFLGDGAGGFRQLPAFTFPNLSSLAATQLLVGDLNHDGKLDLLIGFNSNEGSSPEGDDLCLAVGNGDGTFRAPVALLTHFGPVAIGDLNHDGYLDLVQAHDPDQTSSSNPLNNPESLQLPAAVTVYLGQPGGTFVRSATYALPEEREFSPSPVLLGDFDGDGNLDIAAPYNSLVGGLREKRLAILSGKGDGTFSVSAIPFQLPDLDLPVIGGDYRSTGHTDLLDLIGSTSAIEMIPAGSSVPLAVTFNGSPLIGTTGSATISLVEPASAAQTVTLSASDGAVQMPASVSVPAGSVSQSFSFTIGSGFDRSRLLAITAGLDGAQATDYAGYANPNLSPGVEAIISLPTSYGLAVAAISPGGSAEFLLSLLSQSGYSGIFQNFSCSGLPAGASCAFVQPSLSLSPGSNADTVFAIQTSADTPLGNYTVVVAASNESLTASTQVGLGVGDFSFSLNPVTVIFNGPAAATTNATVIFVEGNNNTVSFACSGLPAGAACTAGVADSASAPVPIQIDDSGASIAPADYAFTVTATGGTAVHSASALLRVENFTAAIDHTTDTLSTTKNATFILSLVSQNHFANSGLQVVCQSQAVSCSATPATAVLTDGGTANVTMTITSNGSSAAARESRSWTPGPIAFLALLLLPFGWWKVRRTHARIVLGALSLALFFVIGACGSGGSSSNPGTGPGTGPVTGGNSQTISLPIYVTAPANGTTLQNSAGTITLTVTK